MFNLVSINFKVDSYNLKVAYVNTTVEKSWTYVEKVEHMDLHTIVYVVLFMKIHS